MKFRKAVPSVKLRSTKKFDFLRHKFQFPRIPKILKMLSLFEFGQFTRSVPCIAMHGITLELSLGQPHFFPWPPNHQQKNLYI